MHRTHRHKSFSAVYPLQNQIFLLIIATNEIELLTFVIISVHFHILEVEMTQKQSDGVNTAPKHR